MVKKLLKFFGFFGFFLLALMAFMPKESFYFLLEEQLKVYGIVVSNESLDSGFFSLNIENLEISIKGVESGIASSSSITILGVYNSVAFRDVTLSSLVLSYAPQGVQTLHLSYSLLDPLHLSAEAIGDFGEAKGAFSLLDKSFEAKIKPSELMQMQYAKTLRMLSKDEDGEYKYAKTF